MDLLSDAKNMVQYRVLFLPKLSDPLNHIFGDTPPVPAINIYNACWLATCIFTTHVMVPVPQSLLLLRASYHSCKVPFPKQTAYPVTEASLIYFCGAP